MSVVKTCLQINHVCKSQFSVLLVFWYFNLISARLDIHDPVLRKIKNPGIVPNVVGPFIGAFPFIPLAEKLNKPFIYNTFVKCQVSLENHETLVIQTGVHEDLRPFSKHTICTQSPKIVL